MRITYRTLANLIAIMDEDQKDSDVTIEITEENGAECFSAELRIAGETHDGGLDDGHPVIYAHVTDQEHDRQNDAVGIAQEIGLLSPPPVSG